MGMGRSDGRQLMGMTDPTTKRLTWGRAGIRRAPCGAGRGDATHPARQWFTEGVEIRGTKLRLHQQQALQEEGAHVDLTPLSLQPVEPA